MHCNELGYTVALALWVLSKSAAAQTIGDYSRAQSAALERNMIQAIGRPLVATDGAAIEAPVAASRDRAAPSAPSSVSDGSEKAVHGPTPVVMVNGVFSIRDRAVAEVLVDGVPYWLSDGDAVPRTSFALHKVSSGRVELERRAGGHVSPADRGGPANVRPLLPPSR